MPTFKTPEPISVTLEFAYADIRVVASQRTDTVVEVRARKGSKGADVSAAERTRVEYSNGQLVLKGPKRRFGIGMNEAIDLTIELPAGSHLRGEASACDLRVEGRLGECTFKTGTGDLSLEETGAVILETGTGNVTVKRAAGRAEIATGTGSIRIREIDGAAAVKNANGDIHIGDIAGEAQLSSARGDISVECVQSSATAKTAKGNIRISQVIRGSIRMETAYGELEVGILEGTSAWLDVTSQYGRVRNSLDTDAGQWNPADTAEVRARTAYGDIVIRRAKAAASSPSPRASRR